MLYVVSVCMGRAVGLTGKDCGGFMRVKQLAGPRGQDLGRVGTELLLEHLSSWLKENGIVS